MSAPDGLPNECVDALHRLRGTRETNTVILDYGHATGVLGLQVQVQGNLTHDELVRALPVHEARLVVHELRFADPDGARRNEHVLILWMPAAAAGQEAPYTAGYRALKDFLTGVHVHLTARRVEHLAYRRLVALAG
ncbi:hypothetical protein ACFQ78_22625 [Streptomyces sp. NPDC056519]|uniref:hypothetical protein n=1 Tax=Streptomyces sp. NPDC056519 TaxID=3345849 RepID=UPI0036918EDE